MIQQNELITFLVGVGAALFILINWRRIRGIPESGWLLAAYALLLSGWTLTLVEGFVFTEAMNALEHACYMISSLAMAVWCWSMFVRQGKRP